MYFLLHPKLDLLACEGSGGGGGGGRADGVRVDWGPEGDPWAPVDPALAEVAAELEKMAVASGGRGGKRAKYLSLPQS